ncbi:MAG: hypothetical protein K5873_09400 [Treponema sp.]|nr:hypothetical protein [Treponema sp.]
MNKEIFLTGLLWFFVFLFFIIACFKCKKVRILPSIFIIIFVTFFSLLTPSGQVLLTVASFRVTLDSLLLGLRRSGILVGMVFFSRIIISSGGGKSFLMKWGKAGQELTKVFFWLNLLTEKKILFKKGHIIQQIDERLQEIWENDMPEEENITNDSSETSEKRMKFTSSSPDFLFDPTRGPCNS